VRIALDIDGLLDEHPEFFRFLSAALQAEGHFVAILTYRHPDSRVKTEEALARWGIAHDALHFAQSLQDKGRLCRELRIDILFDDQDEVISAVDESTLVFKIRNGGNYAFGERKWLSTSKLTRLL
jgi:hypothetical protein